MFFELVSKTRSIRRFDTSRKISGDDIKHILECARLTPSAANLQRVRYMTLNGEEAKRAFSKISLGGYLPDEKKPDVSVAPSAYIVLMTENDSPDVNLSIDLGIAAEVIALAARELGIGSCMIRNFNKEYFKSLQKNNAYFPVLVIALGYPAENVKIVDIDSGGSVKYYKDEDDINCVPKRALSELWVEEIE